MDRWFSKSYAGGFTPIGEGDTERNYYFTATKVLFLRGDALLVISAQFPSREEKRVSSLGMD